MTISVRIAPLEMNLSGTVHRHSNSEKIRRNSSGYAPGGPFESTAKAVAAAPRCSHRPDGDAWLLVSLPWYSGGGLGRGSCRRTLVWLKPPPLPARGQSFDPLASPGVPGEGE